VRIVSWVGKLLVCCRGSWICSGGGGGGLDFGFICGLALFGIGYAICDTGGGMLFVELVRAEDKLERSDRTDNKPELEFGYFGMPAVESAKGMMENTDCEAVVNALCGSLL
jgi:hypothetical protein